MDSSRESVSGGFLKIRKDRIILGRTSEKGNWSLEPNEQESERILKGHVSIADSLEG
jgi:hypothetical protein